MPNHRLTPTTTLVFVSFSSVLFLYPTSQAAVVASYQFEEGTVGTPAAGNNSIEDSSGNGFNGTPNGGPIYRQVNGSQGLVFDGVDDYVFVPDDASFELTDGFTIEATIRIDERSGRPQPIVWRGDNNGASPFVFHVYETDNPNDPYVEYDGSLGLVISDFDAGTFDFVGTVDPLPLGQLLRVAGTFNDATDELGLFIDGELVATSTTELRPFRPLDPNEMPGIRIGHREGQDTFFNGFIDDVVIRDTALAVPEPSSLCLLGIGSLGLVTMRRRRR